MFYTLNIFLLYLMDSLEITANFSGTAGSGSVAFKSLNRNYLEKNCVSHVKHVQTCKNCQMLESESRYSSFIQKELLN